MDNTLYYQMMQMLEGLQRPEGALYIAGALALATMTIGLRWMRWVLLAWLCYVCTFGLSTLAGLNLATPLQQIRTYGRGLCAFMLFLMVIPSIRSHRGWRRHVIPAGLILYFVFQLVSSLRTLYGGDFVRGYFSVLSYSLIFFTLAFGLSRWLQGPKDADAAIKTITAAGLLFCVGCLYQYAINPGQIVHSGRLQGTTGNANHAGALLAVVIPPAIYVFIRARAKDATALLGTASNPWVIRLAAIATASLAGVMLVWTGSRTAAVIAIFGVLLLLRFRLGKFVLVGMVCSVLVLFILSMLESANISTIATRFLDTRNTRTEPWKSLFNTFLESPLIGKEAKDVFGSENSYLLVASRTGVVGLIPFLAGIGLTVANLVRLHRIRRYLGDQILLADLCLAGIMAVLLGGVFEGFLFATFSFPLFVFYIYACITQYLLDYGRMRIQQQQMQYHQSQQPMDEEGYDEEYDPQLGPEYGQPAPQHGHYV
jgi:O-antigen ligase